MNKSVDRLDCRKAKQIDIVDYLSSFGHHPVRTRGEDYWYRSPLRDETNASFKVDRRRNIWYDHGIGKGGNFIDFAMRYHNCTLTDLLKKIAGNFSFQQHLYSSPLVTPVPVIKILKEQELSSAWLLRYLRQRNNCRNRGNLLP